MYFPNLKLTVAAFTFFLTGCTSSTTLKTFPNGESLEQVRNDPGLAVEGINIVMHLDANGNPLAIYDPISTPSFLQQINRVASEAVEGAMRRDKEHYLYGPAQASPDAPESQDTPSMPSDRSDRPSGPCGITDDTCDQRRK